MKHDDELEQLLWELEYELLPEEEANALRERISSDPEIASLYARVREQVTLVADAARVTVPRIALQKTQTDDAQRAATLGNPDVGSSRMGWRQATNWMIGVAATLLMGLVGFAVVETRNDRHYAVAYLRDEPTKPVARDERLRIRVSGPSKLNREIKNEFYFETTTGRGEPQSASLKVRAEDDAGIVKLDEVVATDPKGRASLALPAQMADSITKLEVAEANRDGAAVQVPLAAAAESYVTYLGTDKPRYRHGDIVRFRSVTLSRFGWQADRDMSVQYDVTDPSGNVLEKAKLAGMTTNGVGNGEFAVTDEVPGGQYTLVAQSPENLFAAARQDFYVQPDETRQWDVALTWSESDYLAGDRATAKITVQRPDGKPGADLTVRTEAHVDGHPIEIAEPLGKTNDRGELMLSFPLPSPIAYGQGVLRIAPGEAEAIVERIPIRVENVAVDFYPEGGDLVAGIPSRVYFHSHDALGRPVAVQGQVVDGRGGEVANFETQHEGRGLFRLTPQEAETYSLRITEPGDANTTAKLPAANARGGVVMDCGAGVFEGDQPVTLRLRAQTPPTELLVAANCRGALVGQTTVAATNFVDGSCELRLPIAPEAAGVLRITVFENNEPLAERLVYRRPQRKIAIQFDGLQPSYEPGSQVRLALSCRNESGEPASPVLGVSVVDDAALQLGRPPAPRMATHFCLLGDIESPEKLEDANFYLTDSPDSQAALDLLLGTQGWRRFVRVPATQLAQDNRELRDGYASGLSSAAEGLKRMEAQLAGDTPYRDSVDLSEKLMERVEERPLQLDNSALLGERKETAGTAAKPVTASLAKRKAEPGGANLWIIVATSAALMLIFSAVALLLRLASSRRVAWGGVVIASIALLVGLLGSTSQRQAPAAVEVAERSAAASSEDLAARSELVVPESEAWYWKAPVGGLEKDADAFRVREETTSAPATMPMAAAPEATPAPAPDVPPAPGQSADRRIGGGAGGMAVPARGIAGKDLMPLNQEAAFGITPKLEQAPPPSPLDKIAETEADLKRRETDSMFRKQTAEKTEGAAAYKRFSGLTREREMLRAKSTPGTRSAANPLPAESKDQPQRRLGEIANKEFVVRQYAHTRQLNSAVDETAADFTETVYWNPLLIADPSGRAEIQFNLSDAVTNYRILVDGHQAGRVESASQELKVQKDR